MKKSAKSLKIFAVAIAIATFLFFGGIILISPASRVAVATETVSVWDGTTDTSWWTGHESDDEYTLTSAAQLAGLAELSASNNFENKTFYLATDVDLNGCKSLGVAYNKSQAITDFLDDDTHNVWTPIISFEGTFLGQNHTIYNMSVKEGRYAEGMGMDSGFISYLGANGYIRDLTFDGAIVSGTKTVGVAVGRALNGARIVNIHVQNSTLLVGDCCAGGIVGTSTLVQRCSVKNLTIDCSLGGTELIGGIVGSGMPVSEAPASISVENSEVYNLQITNLATPTYVGLFAGNTQAVSILNGKTNSSIAIDSGDFETTCTPAVVYQNVLSVTIDGDEAANLGSGYIAHSFNAESKNGKEVVITFVAEPSAISFDCTGASAPDYVLDGETLTFTIPNGATSLTAHATMLSDDVTAVFTVGDATPPDPVDPPESPEKIEITISVNDAQSYYGNALALLSATLTSGTLKEGDTLDDVVRLTKADGTQIDTYDITFECINSDYDVSGTVGTYTIIPRPITLTADDKSSVFGDATVTLTYKLTSGSLAEGETLETLSVVLEKAEGNAVGVYNIVIGALNANYDVTSVSGKYTINPRPITVQVGDASCTYGDAIPDNSLTLKSGTLVGKDTLAGIVSLSEPSSFGAGDYHVTALSKSQNYNITFVYSQDGYSLLQIAKKDVSDLIETSISNGSEIVQGTSVTCSIPINGVRINAVLTIAGEIATDTQTAGEYVLTATVEHDNYSGSKQITFTVYTDVRTVVERISSLLDVYMSAEASDTERINALFEAQSIYASLTAKDLQRIAENDEYQTVINSFVSEWNALRQGATQDLATAESTYDKTLAAVVTALASASALAFAMLKAFLH